MTHRRLGRVFRLGVGALLLAHATPAHADGAEEYGGRRKVPNNAADLCEVADSNLARARDAILRDAKRATSPVPMQRWDHKTAPKYLDLFERRFRLRPVEKDILYKQGVASFARLSFESYATAFHEIYQSQLPLYVSMDALLHAVYASNDQLMAALEQQIAAPKLLKFLAALRSELKTYQSGIPTETAHDADLYVTVAARLIGDKTPALFPTTEGEANSLLSRIKEAKGLTEVSLFGRARMVDFSQYAARGHYAEEPQMTALFQAAMWLSRLELNLVSRSSRSSAPGIAPDPRETPREAVLALALANLMQRSGVSAEVLSLDSLWTLLAGQREDVSLPSLLVLQKQAGITDLRAPDVSEKLRAAIGSRYVRTVSMHYMPQGSAQLPVIATVLGPRVVSDAQSLRPLVHDAIAGKYRVQFPEIAYALGHDRGLAFLTADLANFPTLRSQLTLARKIFETPSPAAATDLYSAWMQAVQRLSVKPIGVRPSFMDTEVYADLLVNSAAAGYAQIKHNYVLVAGQPYDLGGCAIPDGYVEPAKEVLNGLREYARRGEQAIAALDPTDLTSGLSYFRRLGKLLDVFSVIVNDELQGKPLSVEQRRFLSMVVEMAPGSSGGPPTYTGWYFDLFRQRGADGLGRSQLVADYYTSVNIGEAAYVGVADVRLGVFVVDVGGAPRAMIGPIARAYETHQPLGGQTGRIDDTASAELPENQRSDPWARSYTAAAPTDIPKLFLTYEPDHSPNITVEAEEPATDVTLALLDHHRQPMATMKRSFPKGKTIVRFPAKSANGAPLTGRHVHGLSVERGEFFAWAAIQRGGMAEGIYLNTGRSRSN